MSSRTSLTERLSVTTWYRPARESTSERTYLTPRIFIPTMQPKPTSSSSSRFFSETIPRSHTTTTSQMSKRYRSNFAISLSRVT